MSESLNLRNLCSCVRRVMAGAALCIAGWNTAQGQDRVPAATSTSQLRQRADSLAKLLAAARLAEAEWLRADSVRAADLLASDSSRREIRVGGLRITADTVLLDLASRAGAMAWSALYSTFGSEAQHVGEERWILRVLTDSGSGGPRHRIVQVGYQPASGPASYTSLQHWSERNAREIAVHWRRRGDLLMLDRRKSTTAGWVYRLIGTGEDRQDLLESVYRTLAAGGDGLGLSCLDGDIWACRTGLGLADPRDSSATFVEAVRATVLNMALEVGGSEAYPRFVRDSARTAAERLQDAAQMPLDSLLGQWRQRVLRARPAPASTPARTALIALAWGTLLCAISLRSSRWR